MNNLPLTLGIVIAIQAAWITLAMSMGMHWMKLANERGTKYRKTKRDYDGSQMMIEYLQSTIEYMKNDWDSDDAYMKHLENELEVLNASLPRPLDEPPF